MTRVMDEELKKAFAEQHEKMRDTSRKLRLADIQIESLRRTKQRSELTIKEVASLPAGTKTYESVGRTFILDSDIKSGLESRIKMADEKIKSLEDKKTYLQQNLKESENNLREMVQQRQNKDSSD